MEASQSHVVSAPKRAVSDVAWEIRRLWTKPYFGAVPYLAAMVQGDYGYDGEKSVVLYFLSNARTWRGPDAKRLKAELKSLVGVR